MCAGAGSSVPGRGDRPGGGGSSPGRWTGFRGRRGGRRARWGSSPVARAGLPCVTWQPNRVTWQPNRVMWNGSRAPGSSAPGCVAPAVASTASSVSSASVASVASGVSRTSTTSSVSSPLAGAYPVAPPHTRKPHSRGTRSEPAWSAAGRARSGRSGTGASGCRRASVATPPPSRTVHQYVTSRARRPVNRDVSDDVPVEQDRAHGVARGADRTPLRVERGPVGRVLGGEGRRPQGLGVVGLPEEDRQIAAVDLAQRDARFDAHGVSPGGTCGPASRGEGREPRTEGRLPRAEGREQRGGCAR